MEREFDNSISNFNWMYRVQNNPDFSETKNIRI